MSVVLVIVGILVIVAITCWLGRGEPNTHLAPSNTFGGGSGSLKLGPLTEAEMEAHEEEVERESTLRLLDQDGWPAWVFWATVGLPLVAMLILAVVLGDA